MIKRYLQFVKENLVEDHRSFGEWVDSLMSDDYIKNIVTRYTNEIDPSIEVSNAVNLLDPKTQNEIRGQIERYLETGIEDKEPEIIVSTETEELLESQEVSVVGKGVFTSFLKSLTALGQKENKPNWNKTPDDFLLYYFFQNLNSEEVKLIFSRFKSLQRYLHLISYDKNEVSLYFGLKCDGQFEYGIYYEGNLPIGQFKISKSTIKWIVSLESKSAQSLKKELVNLSYEDILTLGKIKQDMKVFSPGYYERKLTPELKDRVISFGYYGVGKWDNGKLDEGELMNIKNNFTTYLLSKRWGTKVLISVKAVSFWVYLHIKLK